MKERCPKCESFFIQWDSGNKRFHCLQRNCLHAWLMPIREPVENIYLRTTLPMDKETRGKLSREMTVELVKEGRL
ncbi:MAG: hypothetical protein AAB404_01645 [Patescibacteria group bacterium]